MDAFQGNLHVLLEISTRPVVISDPLHLVERIRHRQIYRTFSFSEQELLFFFIKSSKSRVSVASRVFVVIIQ
jgi:hypothetical protein